MKDSIFLTINPVLHTPEDREALDAVAHALGLSLPMIRILIEENLLPDPLPMGRGEDEMLLYLGRIMGTVKSDAFAKRVHELIVEAVIVHHEVFRENVLATEPRWPAR